MKRLRNLRRGMVALSLVAIAVAATLGAGVGAQSQGPTETDLPSDDLVRRYEAVNDQLPSDTLSAIQSDPSYAGMFISSHPKIGLVILTTNSPKAFEGIVSPFETAETKIQVRQVELGYSELEALQSRIVEDVPLWQREGVSITRVGIRPQDNRVEISINEKLSADVDEAFAKAYGNSVVIAEKPGLGSVPLLYQSSLRVAFGGDADQGWPVH